MSRCNPCLTLELQAQVYFENGKKKKTEEMPGVQDKGLGYSTGIPHETRPVCTIHLVIEPTCKFSILLLAAVSSLLRRPVAHAK